MILLHDLSLAFGQQVVFDHINATIDTGQRIGLVGINGSGKTTLLKAIAGSQYLDEGAVSKSKDCTVAYLPQEVTLSSTRRIMSEALSAFANGGIALAQLYDIELAMQHQSVDQHMLEQYAHLQHETEAHNLATARQEVEQTLIGLGFKKDVLNNTVDTLSEGWKMRLVLAKLLLQKADFYLFDEPTNHLDLPAKDWFCTLLQNAPWGFMLVSHDQYFLDHACAKIYELENGKLNVYNGNYTFYRTHKEASQEQLERKALEQEKYIARQQATIDRFRAKATKARMAQSMLKALEKVERIELVHTPKLVRIPLPQVQHTGKVVLEVRGVSFAFQKNTPLFERVAFNLMRGSKVALVAPNGTGKTTLLNLIRGTYHPTHGTITFGYQVSPVFFDQDQNRALNSKNTVLQEVEGVCSTAEQRARVRSLLGAFLFSGTMVDKKIEVLSGGEKNRVAMVKVLLQDANFLVLDEPTNHLDIASKEILLQALKQYEGTILFVSHDRTFLNNLATHITELTPKGTHTYTGNYDNYLYYRQAAAEKQTSTTPTETQKRVAPEKKDNQHAQRKQLRSLEGRIERLEQEINALHLKLGTARYGSPEYTKAHNELAKATQTLAQLTTEWEELMGHIASE